MVTISPALSPAQVVEYHKEEFAKPENYYQRGAQTQGEWQGLLASRLGLNGPIDIRDFTRLAYGQHPVTGEQMVEYVSTKPYIDHHGVEVTPMEHRAAWDATFSAPKSVSVLQGYDDRVIGWHEASVAIAVDYGEQHIQSRTGGIRPALTTLAWAAGKFTHSWARPVNGASDAQLHTHVVFFNVTERPDGDMTALQPREIFRSQALMTAVYRSELSRRILAAGYNVHVGRHGQPEIQGFSDAYLKASSRRRAQVLAHMEAHGVEGARSAQIAAHGTRDAKSTTLSHEAMVTHHQRVAEAFGDQPATVVQAAQARGRVVVPAASPAVLDDALDYATARCEERWAVFDEREVLVAALRRSQGEASASEIAEAMETRVAQGWFLLRPSSAAPFRTKAGDLRTAPVHIDRGVLTTARSFTTPAMVTLEHATVARMQAGQRTLPPLLTAEEMPAALARHPDLTDDQRQAFVQLLSSTDRVTGLEGVAGSGKTYLLSALRDEMQRLGMGVQGLAPLSRAAHKLAEAGMSTQTIQRYLQPMRPSPNIAAKSPDGKALSVTGAPDTAAAPGQPECLFLDESSLASTVMMHAFLDAIGPQTRVFIDGDARQHQSIGAGRSYEQLQEWGLQVARLNDIRRQLDTPWLKAVVEDLAVWQVKPALDKLQGKDRVHGIADRQARLEAIRDAYLQHHTDTLLISPDNRSRLELNAIIREGLQARGLVKSDQAPMRTLVDVKEMTTTDLAFANHYQPDWVVRFNQTSAHFRRGEYATVVSGDKATNLLTVRRADGTEAAFDPRRLKAVSVYLEETRTFAVGDRIRFTAGHPDKRVPNQELGTIAAMTLGQIRIKLDSGRSVAFATKDFPHLDHGYAVTSYSSQGQTAGRVILMIDTTRGHENLVNQRLAYVALSRAMYDACVYTDDVGRMRLNVARLVSNRSAIERGVAYIGERQTARWARIDQALAGLPKTVPVKVVEPSHAQAVGLA